MQQGAWGPFELWCAKLGFLSSCTWGVGPPLELRQATWGSSHVATEYLGLQLSCSWEHGFLLELQRETWGPSPVAAEYSQLLLSCGGNSGFLLSCSTGLRVPLEPWWGTQSSSLVGGYSGFLLSCRGASSRVVLGRLFSSRDVQYGFSLVAVSQWLLTCFGMGLYFSCGWGQLCSCGGFESL